MSLMLPDATPLGEARLWLRQRAMQDGSRCPCCTQLAKVYKRPIHATMAKALIKCWQAGGTSEFVHVPTVAGPACEVGKLRYWGLIEEEPTVRPDGGRSGWWRVTPRGGRFIAGDLTVPRYAHIYDGRCLGTSGDQIDIRTALGTRFSYDALMRGQA